MTDEVERPPLKYDPTTIGTTGLRQFGGFVEEEFQKELRHQNGARIYREMADNDPVVGAVVFAITMLIRQVPWNVQAVDDSPVGEAAKKFVEEIMHDMSVSWSTVISEICSMFVYGYSPLEIVWKRRGGPDAKDSTSRSQYKDNKIGIRSLSLRAQPTIFKWAINEQDGTIDGLWQQPYYGPMVFIPIEKLLLFRTSEERGNPEGRSILRNAYRPWYFKKRIEEIEAVGIERDLAGLPVAYIPGQYLSQSADALDRQVAQEFKRLIKSIKRDTHEGIILPSSRDQSGNLLFDIKLLSTGGSRQFDTVNVIERYNKSIATSVLADFIFLGQSAVGSFALSSDKTALFATAIGAYTHCIAEVFNRHLLPRLWRLNGFDFEVMPSIEAGDLEKPDLMALGDFVSKMTASGATMFPDRELENHLRKMAGLPLAPEDGEEEFDPEYGEAQTEQAQQPEQSQAKEEAY